MLGSSSPSSLTSLISFSTVIFLGGLLISTLSSSMAQPLATQSSSVFSSSPAENIVSSMLSIVESLMYGSMMLSGLAFVTHPETKLSDSLMRSCVWSQNLSDLIVEPGPDSSCQSGLLVIIVNRFFWFKSLLASKPSMFYNNETLSKIWFDMSHIVG